LQAYLKDLVSSESVGEAIWRWSDSP
jgi:hypothetical protein